MLWKLLGVFFLSMVPVIELRGGVPLAIGWGINEIWAIVICVIGNMIPVPFIYLFSRKILTYGADKRFIGKICRWMLAKGERAGQKLVRKAGRTGLFIAMMLFVGIPIPGTGAWTGTMGASFLCSRISARNFSWFATASGEESSASVFSNFIFICSSLLSI